MAEGATETQAADAINACVKFKQDISGRVWLYANELIQHKIESQMIGMPAEEANDLRQECLLQIGSDTLINTSISPDVLHSVMVLVFKEKYGEQR